MSDLINNIFTRTDCLTSEIIAQYVKDTLADEQKRLVEKHLADCEMCRDMLDGYQLLENENELEAITAQLNKKIDGKILNSKTTQVSFWRKPVFAVAASLLLIFSLSALLLFIFQKMDNSYVAQEMKHENQAVAQDTFGAGNVQKNENTESDEDAEKVKSSEETSKSVVSKSEKNKKEEIEGTVNTEIGPVQNENENKIVESLDKAVNETIVSEDMVGENNQETYVVADAELSKTTADDVAKKDENINLGAKANQNQSVVINEATTNRGVLKRLVGNDTKRAKNVSMVPSIADVGSLKQVTEEKIYTNQEMNLGIAEYQAKNYLSALPHFEKALIADSLNNDANYFAGVSCYNINDYTKAIAYLSMVIQNPKSEYYDEANWLIAQSLEKSGKKEEAIVKYVEISKSSSLYKTPAEEKITELRKK